MDGTKRLELRIVKERKKVERKNEKKDVETT